MHFYCVPAFCAYVSTLFLLYCNTSCMHFYCFLALFCVHFYCVPVLCCSTAFLLRASTLGVHFYCVPVLCSSAACLLCSSTLGVHFYCCKKVSLCIFLLCLYSSILRVHFNAFLLCSSTFLFQIPPESCCK